MGDVRIAVLVVRARREREREGGGVREAGERGERSTEISQVLAIVGCGAVCKDNGCVGHLHNREVVCASSASLWVCGAVSM